MLIADFKVKGITLFKPEADAPLIINGYRVLLLTAGSQLMSLIPGRYLKVIKAGNQIDVFQLPRSP